MVFPYLVIPAQARIQCLRFLNPCEKQSFHSPCGRAGHFLLCGQEKVTKEKATPDGALFGHPALRVRDRTAGFAGCTSVCIQRTGAHPARHPAGCSFVRSPRLRGGRFGGILPQKQKQEQPLSHPPVRGSAGMHGVMDQRRRSRCRASQVTAENARRGAHRMCARRLTVHGCTARRPHRHREAQEHPAAHDARGGTASGARPFWLLFGAMPKSNPRSGAARTPCFESNRLAAGETKLCTST